MLRKTNFIFSSEVLSFLSQCSLPAKLSFNQIAHHYSVLVIDREPRRFIQLKRYKRFDGPNAQVWGPGSTIGVAAGTYPVHLAWVD